MFFSCLFVFLLFVALLALVVLAGLGCGLFRVLRVIGKKPGIRCKGCNKPYLDPNSMYNNGPIPPKTAQKAIT